MGLLQYADRAIRTATTACCHTHNRVAGHSGWTDTRIRTMAGMSRIRSYRSTHADTSVHIRTMAGMYRIRIHSYRSTRADTRADVPCD